MTRHEDLTPAAKALRNQSFRSVFNGEVVDVMVDHGRVRVLSIGERHELLALKRTVTDRPSDAPERGALFVLLPGSGAAQPDYTELRFTHYSTQGRYCFQVVNADRRAALKSESKQTEVCLKNMNAVRRIR